MMKTCAFFLAAGAACSLGLSLPAYADDHFVTPEIATEGRLSDDLPESPGQGVPFIGEHDKVPATEVREDDQRDFPGVGAEAAPNADRFK